MMNMSRDKYPLLIYRCHFVGSVQGDYVPKPADIRNVTLTRGMLEMAERMAENAHDIWARKKKIELEGIGLFVIV